MIARRLTDSETDWCLVRLDRAVSDGQILTLRREGKIVETLSSGGICGEMALIDGGPRRADVVALTYCTLLELRSRDFEKFLKANPDISGRIDEVAKERGVVIEEMTRAAGDPQLAREYLLKVSMIASLRRAAEAD